MKKGITETSVNNDAARYLIHLSLEPQLDTAVIAEQLIESTPSQSPSPNIAAFPLLNKGAIHEE